VALDRGQQTVLRRIVSIGRRRGASPKELKAAVETGLVESDLRNLPGGDADSAGWRQERASLYRNPTNLDASINRFFDETRGVRGKYGSAGALAAAVQRPAAQYRGRYQGVSGEAERLLGMTGGRGGSSAGTGSAGTDASSPQAGVDGSGGQELAALLAAATEPAQPRTSMGLATPAFAARAVLPEGAQAVQSQAAPQESPGAALQAALTAIRGMKGPDLPEQPQSPAGGLQAAPGGAGRYPLGRRGKLIGTPHAGTHTLGNWQSDNAVDLAVPVGTPIYALEDGVVAKTRDRPSGGGRFAGGQITLAGRGNDYFYGHTSQINVRPGQRVRKGQIIGRTGSANGVAHLHLGVERGDPRRVIGQGR
jgi:murein DD-endopeptidase MepM/ murein hydrolase activator NlpD